MMSDPPSCLSPLLSSLLHLPRPTLPLGGANLSSEDLTKAQKYCKYAGSALQYEDVDTAVQNLQKALKLLTTGRE